MLTYRKLLEYIQSLPEDNLDDNVSIFDVDSKEFYSAKRWKLMKDDDVLDKGHAYIEF